MLPDSPLGPGFVQVYTGEGKGKTTAALGLALRAVGSGLSVLVVQFLKAPGVGEDGGSGEQRSAKRLAPLLEVRPRGGEGMVDPLRPSPADVALAREALAEAESEMLSGRWDLLVLDEVNTAVHFGLLALPDLLALLDRRPQGVELVLTGRYAPGEILKRADLVTEMREVRHYFRRGVPARRGIEK